MCANIVTENAQMNNMVKVKICGITCLEDAVSARENGADNLGFIFVKGTPRCVHPDDVSRILKDMPPGMDTSSGITVLFENEDPERVISVVSACGADHVQLQGEESPGYCGLIKERTGSSILKVFKVYDSIIPNGAYMPGDYPAADYFVFDTFHPYMPGGTGLRFDWDVIVKEKRRLSRPFFLAGGLDASNVAEAVRSVRPYGVDVSSGVEKSPGSKDAGLIKEFIKNAKQA